jgi:transcription-repair coupling factor (superfamily II helicase)
MIKSPPYFNPLSPILTNHTRQEWGRLTGSSSALVISRIAPQRPLLLIVPDVLAAQRLSEEISFYGDSNDLMIFPDWETLPYDKFSPHSEIISQRLTALFHLPTRRRGVLIIPIATLMHRLPPLGYVQTHNRCITTGQHLNSEQLCEQLEQLGYRSVSQVMEHGEFATRGSLLDLFPMGTNTPCRLDLAHEVVKTIRHFDLNTQRSEQAVEFIQLLPAREFPFNREAIERFRSQWRLAFSGNPTRHLMYREITNGLAKAGVEYYLPLFFEKMGTLFDYLPKSTIIITLPGVMEVAEQFWREVNERYEQLRHDLEYPLLPPAQLFLQANQIFGEIHHYSHLHLHEEEIASEINFATQPPPSLPIEARSPQPLVRLKDFIANFPGRILLTAETTGRRESLRELFHKYDLIPQLVENWQAFLHSKASLCLTVASLEQGLVVEFTPFATISKVPPLQEGGNSTSSFQEEENSSFLQLVDENSYSSFQKEENSSFLQLVDENSYSLAVICETQLFGERVAQRRRRKSKTQRDTEAIVRDLTELTIGAPVVHEAYGVGRYHGLITLTVGGVEGEFLHLEYANQAKLYIPVASLHLLSRFTGMDTEHAPLHRLGSEQWEKSKRQAAQQAIDVATELLQVYAQRAARQGYAFDVHSIDYQAFADAFPFEETPDQQDAIAAVLADMAAPKPMDRLICGDVGFGKTEVAMRAAFICVQNHHQVAVLVPTTLLAQQHYQTFQDRFADWPVRIEQLTRFRTAKQQEGILTAIATGHIDIIIGTHKLLQNNVKFHKLGLVIIDEEHRFGVKQKEQFKRLRAEVDILTLTATPIPRSLNQALSNLRDLSIIATPPFGRLAIKTFVMEWYAPSILEAIWRELKRGGQIYFLHNDIETIEQMATELQQLVPAAQLRIAHGKMRERELERAMQDFYHRRFNLLICTTIIETGIDIPNANTIIINRADKLGLAQLYQLRGRVGRSQHRAYAYLIVPPREQISADAQKRLDAISALEDLGMGLMLATHDLEIRGAGELLGHEQSGHVQEVGYTLYMELLERAVNMLKSGQQLESDQLPKSSTEVNLHTPAILPSDYIPDIHTRLIMYQRLAKASDIQTLEDIQVEMIDRFGLLPPAAKALVQITALKLQAMLLGIRKIDFGEPGGYILFDHSPRVELSRVIQLVQSQPHYYQLDRYNKLHLSQRCSSFAERYQVMEQLLATLVGRVIN